MRRRVSRDAQNISNATIVGYITMTPSGGNDEFRTWPGFTITAGSNKSESLYIAYLNNITAYAGWIAPEYSVATSTGSTVTFAPLDAVSSWYLDGGTPYVFAIYSLPAASPITQELVLSGFEGLTFVPPSFDLSNLVFSPQNVWAGELRGPLAVDSNDDIYVAGDLTSSAANSISIIAPGDALPTQSLTGFSGSVQGAYIDRFGQIYAWGNASSDPGFIDVFPPKSTGNAKPSRVILGSSWPFSIRRIVADSSGRIYILASFEHGPNELAILPANASGTTAAQIVPGFALSPFSSSLAIDSHDNVYGIDAVVTSQIDIGRLDSSGTFQPIGSLAVPRWQYPPSFLAVDGNDDLVVNEGDEFDVFAYGNVGNAAPTSVSVVPGPLRSQDWSDGIFLPGPASRMPTPPPSSYIVLTPSSLSLSISGANSAQFTATEPGYNGQFQVAAGSCNVENAFPSAEIAPQTGTTFTVTVSAGDGRGTCNIALDDSLGHRALLMVQVSN
jgi:hypothetical protein